jgi:HK97 family phage major capsid protein
MTLHTQLRASSALATSRPVSTPEDIRAALDENAKKVHDELAKMIVAEREANEERFKTLADGKSVADVDSKLEKVRADIDKAMEVLNEIVKDAARAKLAGGATPLAGQRDVRADAQRFFAATGRLQDGQDVSDEQVAAYQGYEKTFWRNVRAAYPQVGGRFVNEMEVGSDKQGGFWAPTTTFDRIITKLRETSPVRQVAGQVTISTNDLELPIDVDDVESGGWVAEKAGRPNTGTPEVGVQKISTFEQFANPRVTQTFLDDAGIDVEGYLSEKVRSRLGRTENTAFVSGNGAGKPTGFLAYAAASVTTADATRDWGALQHVLSGGAAGFPYASGEGSNPDALIDLIAELHPEFRPNARFAMNRRSEAVIRKLKDGNGNYHATFTQLQSGVFGLQIFGYNSVTFEDMPNFDAGTFPIAFGDFGQGYLIVDRMGIRVLRDPYTAKPFVQFYTTKRVGGDVVNFDAIKLLKCGAPG